MKPKRRPAKLLLLALALCLLGLLAWSWSPGGPLWWEPVWWLAILDKEWTDESELWTADHLGDNVDLRGFNRGSDRTYHDSVHWHEETGFKAIQLDCRYGHYRITWWNPDGTVMGQFEGQYIWGGIEPTTTGPPWKFGHTDQTEPTMPEWPKGDDEW